MSLSSDIETCTYQVVSWHEWGGNVVQVLLQPIAHFLSYQAGQYIQIACPNGGNWLPLSIANAPRNDHVIELHIRHHPGDVDTQALLSTLQQRNQLSLAGPFGHAVYRDTPDLPIILLAGGTGMAPLKAVLEQATALNDARRWHLYWGVRTATDFYLPAAAATEWQSGLAFTETRVISQPACDVSYPMQSGYTHTAVLRDYADLTSYQVYASGPARMVAAAYQLFIQHGLLPAHFYSDIPFTAE